MPKKYTIYIFILFHKQKKKQFKVYKKMAYLAFVKIYKNSFKNYNLQWNCKKRRWSCYTRGNKVKKNCKKNCQKSCKKMKKNC